MLVFGFHSSESNEQVRRFLGATGLLSKLANAFRYIEANCQARKLPVDAVAKVTEEISRHSHL